MKIWMIILAVLTGTEVYAQNRATAREIDTVMITYPFSDPDPVPNTGKIYPYFRFDGFTTKPEKQTWKMVELENDFIKVQITPEIGGKIWAAYDKTRNKPFIYGNDVVKFRDIAMRGAWTSGGIEFNFGIIGHTPAVSNPVDYLVRENPDGSASCFITGLDLLTESRWGVEIRLPEDAARMSTRVFWYNDSPVTQPYYTWMNLAVPAADDLRFVEPGTRYITHGGEAHPWPLDSARQKDLSVYRQNDFTGSKSYHIAGTREGFFGTFYEDSRDGMIHFAERDDKIGRKVFMWSLAGSGQIWEDLLTDHAGQYVELQSGRLFNQNSMTSSRTPFKQVGMHPYQTDHWVEYWYPYHELSKIDHADAAGVLMLEENGNRTLVRYMAVEAVTDTLMVRDRTGKILHREAVSLAPLESTEIAVSASKEEMGKVSLGKMQYLPDGAADFSYNRPMSAPQEFDPESGYYQYLLGRDAAGFRQYRLAGELIDKSLAQDSFFVPALAEKAALLYRSGKYLSAYQTAAKALAVDTYDPAANYYYGLSAINLGRKTDAADGFEVAALSQAWRSAAWYQLAACYFRDENFFLTRDYLEKVLAFDPMHMNARHLQLVLDRMTGRDDPSVSADLLSLFPVNHLVNYEKYLRTKSDRDLDFFRRNIRDELPEQTYLQLGLWYLDLGLPQEAADLMELAPESNLTDYWLAYLHRDTPAGQDRLAKANAGNPAFIFPFRAAASGMLEWMTEHAGDWKSVYYLALLRAHQDRHDEAGKLLLSLPDDLDFAPLYAWRALFQQEAARKESDLRRALKLQPEQWRYYLALADHLAVQQDFGAAQKLLAGYYQDHPDSYQTGLALARLYLTTDRLPEAEKVLAEIQVLPYEGASEGRVLYRAVKLLRALDYLGKKEWKQSGVKVEEALLWPENLGVGKPFEEQIDTEWESRIGEWIQRGRSGESPDAQEVLSLRNKIKKRFLTYREKAPF